MVSVYLYRHSRAVTIGWVKGVVQPSNGKSHLLSHQVDGTTRHTGHNMCIIKKLEVLRHTMTALPRWEPEIVNVRQ
jgi:hypothetical protein